MRLAALDEPRPDGAVDFVSSTYDETKADDPGRARLPQRRQAHLMLTMMEDIRAVVYSAQRQANLPALVIRMLVSRP